MGTLLNAVALPGIDHHFGFNAERFQRMVKLVSLNYRDERIGFTVENECGCRAVLDKVEWRVSVIYLASTHWCTPQS